MSDFFEKFKPPHIYRIAASYAGFICACGILGSAVGQGAAPLVLGALGIALPALFLVYRCDDGYFHLPGGIQFSPAVFGKENDRGYFHLLPNGWWMRQDSEPFPADRVETWKYSVIQIGNDESWGTPKEHRDLTCVWVNPAISRTERDAIRGRLGWPAHVRRGDDTIGDPL